MSAPGIVEVINVLLCCVKGLRPSREVQPTQALFLNARKE